MYSPVVDDVYDDGEMGIGKNHLEFVSDLNSSDHVADSASNSAQYSVSFLLLKPHSEFEGGSFSFFWIFLADFDGNVFKSFSKGAKFSLDDNLTGFSFNCNSFGDGKLLLCNNILHDGD